MDHIINIDDRSQDQLFELFESFEDKPSNTKSIIGDEYDPKEEDIVDIIKVGKVYFYIK